MRKRPAKDLSRKQALIALGAFFLVFVGISVYQGLFALALADVGDFLLKWGYPSGSKEGQFQSPYGVAVDGGGNVYVADSDNNRIQKFDGDGGFIWAKGDLSCIPTCTGNGEFDFPTAIAVDAEGYVYVADTGNNRIQKLDSDGNYLRQWDGTDEELGQFRSPYGVSVDQDGYVYVADMLNHAVRKFDSSGNQVDYWGEYGGDPDQIRWVRGVAAGWPGIVYSSDSWEDRVQGFSNNGDHLITWGDNGLGGSFFKDPFGLAVDGAGQVYVADALNHRIQVFAITITDTDAVADYVTRWGEQGDEDGQFERPYGVAVDAAGHIFVADTGNHRIQKFSGAVPGVALTVTKTAEPVSAVAYHGSVTYTVLLDNSSGIATAFDVALTDTLPAEVTFAGWLEQPDGAVMAGDELTWQGTVTTGEALTFTFQVNHTGDYGQTVINEAEYDHFSGSGSDEASFTVVGAPGLSITKAAEPQGAVAYGGNVTYTIVLSNGGAGDASGVMLTDTLPAEVTFADWLEQPDGAGVAFDELTWQGTVTAGEALTFTFYVTHTGDYGDVVTNTAEYDHSTGSGSAEALFTIVGAPELSISKGAEPQGMVAYGGNVTYTIVLSNSGAGDASGVMLTDTLLTKVTFAGWLDRPAGADHDSGEITWQGTVTAGEALTFTFYVTHTGDYGDVVTNTAAYEHVTGSGSAEATFSVGDPDLAISKEVSPQSDLEPNDQVTYTIVLSNDGDTDALGVALTDTLPEEVTFAGWLKRPAGADHDNGKITWQGTVTAGVPLPFAFVVTYDGGAGDVVTNEAEYVHSTSSGSDEASFTVLGAPELSMTKAAEPQGTVAYGGNVTYTIVLTNGGERDASGVTLTDTLPTKVTFAGWLDRPAGADHDSGEITWQGTVTAGEAVTFTFYVTHIGDYGDVVTNTAAYEHPTGSGSAEATFSVGEPDLAISKEASPESDVEPGDLVTYTIVLSNDGDTDALGVMLTDTLPGQMTFVGWIERPAGADHDSGEITWQGTVKVGIPLSFDFVVTYDGGSEDVVTNEAEYWHSTSSGSGDASFTVLGAPALSMVKLVSPEVVSTGGLLTYTIVLSNTGESDALNVIVSDTLPGQVAFAHWAPGGQPPEALLSQGELSWKGTVTKAQKIRFAFVVTNTGENGEVVTNTAEFDHSSGSDTAEAVFEVEVLTTFVVYLPVILR